MNKYQPDAISGLYRKSEKEMKYLLKISFPNVFNIFILQHVFLFLYSPLNY